MLVGGNPFQTTSIYALIHTLEQKWGVWFARGGTGALVIGNDEIVRGHRRTNSIFVRGRRRSASMHRPSSRVSSSTMEYQFLLMQWSQTPRSRARTWTSSLRAIESTTRTTGSRRCSTRCPCSSCISAPTVSTTISHITKFSMGPRYRELLEDVFRRKILARDFSLYLHRPTATDKSLAPAGSDAWYVLSPVPHLGGKIDWSEAASPIATRSSPISRTGICRVFRTAS